MNTWNLKVGMDILKSALLVALVATAVAAGSCGLGAVVALSFVLWIGSIINFYLFAGCENRSRSKWWQGMIVIFHGALCFAGMLIFAWKSFRGELPASIDPTQLKMFLRGHWVIVAATFTALTSLLSWFKIATEPPPEEIQMSQAAQQSGYQRYYERALRNQ